MCARGLGSLCEAMMSETEDLGRVMEGEGGVEGRR